MRKLQKLSMLVPIKQTLLYGAAGVVTFGAISLMVTSCSKKESISSFVSQADYYSSMVQFCNEYTTYANENVNIPRTGEVVAPLQEHFFDIVNRSTYNEKTYDWKNEDADLTALANDYGIKLLSWGYVDAHMPDLLKKYRNVGGIDKKLQYAIEQAKRKNVSAYNFISHLDEFIASEDVDYDPLIFSDIVHSNFINVDNIELMENAKILLAPYYDSNYNYLHDDDTKILWQSNKYEEVTVETNDTRNVIDITNIFNNIQDEKYKTYNTSYFTNHSVANNEPIVFFNDDNSNISESQFTSSGFASKFNTFKTTFSNLFNYDIDVHHYYQGILANDNLPTFIGTGINSQIIESEIDPSSEFSWRLLLEHKSSNLASQSCVDAENIFDANVEKFESSNNFETSLTEMNLILEFSLTKNVGGEDRTFVEYEQKTAVFNWETVPQIKKHLQFNDLYQYGNCLSPIENAFGTSISFNDDIMYNTVTPESPSYKFLDAESFEGKGTIVGGLAPDTEPLVETNPVYMLSDEEADELGFHLNDNNTSYMNIWEKLYYGHASNKSPDMAILNEKMSTENWRVNYKLAYTINIDMNGGSSFSTAIITAIAFPLLLNTENDVIVSGRIPELTHNIPLHWSEASLVTLISADLLASFPVILNFLAAIDAFLYGNNAETNQFSFIKDIDQLLKKNEEAYYEINNLLITSLVLSVVQLALDTLILCMYVWTLNIPWIIIQTIMVAADIAGIVLTTLEQISIGKKYKLFHADDGILTAIKNFRSSIAQLEKNPYVTLSTVISDFKAYKNLSSNSPTTVVNAAIKTLRSFLQYTILIPFKEISNFFDDMYNIVFKYDNIPDKDSFKNLLDFSKLVKSCADGWNESIPEIIKTDDKGKLLGDAYVDDPAQSRVGCINMDTSVALSSVDYGEYGWTYIITDEASDHYCAYFYSTGIIKDPSFVIAIFMFEIWAFKTGIVSMLIFLFPDATAEALGAEDGNTASINLSNKIDTDFWSDVVPVAWKCALFLLKMYTFSSNMLKLAKMFMAFQLAVVNHAGAVLGGTMAGWIAKLFPEFRMKWQTCNYRGFQYANQLCRTYLKVFRSVSYASAAVSLINFAIEVAIMVLVANLKKTNLAEIKAFINNLLIV